MENFKGMNQKELMNVVGGDKVIKAFVDYAKGFIPGSGEAQLVIDLVKATATPPPAHAYNKVPDGYQSGGSHTPGSYAVNMIA